MARSCGASRVPWLAAAWVLGLAAGCSRPPDPVTVTGRVEYSDGKPAPRMLLTLQPRDAVNKNCVPAAAIDDKDGSFNLEKVVPGNYVATLQPMPIVEGGAGGPGAPGGPPGGAPGASGVLTAYRTAETSTLKVEVPVGGKEGLVLKVNGR